MNIVYNASAGTGKTYQVTQLYEQLVLTEKIDPREILLMTFTDNAAAELRMRVTHRLLKARRTAETEGNDELAELSMTAQSHLPSAPIGTIHSFCTRLLREYALDAGLSPGFSALVGDDRDELLAQICRDELLTRLESDSDFKTFCTGAQMIGSGGGFGTSITETVPALISQAGSLGISLENAEAMLPEPVPPASRTDFEQICQRIDDLPRITPTVQTALNILRQALQETTNVESLVERLQELGIKKFGRGGAKEISADFWALKESVTEAVRYRERFPAAKAFARYIQSVTRQFQQRKHAMDAVDFDDQLRMAAELLKSGQATPNFRYVIVDEVQDTSRIQCELIQSLWGEETNLIICGDKKQSIYTWRGADPQVMPDLEAAIMKRENSERRDLQTSYRSKAPIIDIVNRLFESVYDSASYSAADQLEPNPDFKTPGEKPCIEFLAPDDEIADLTKQEKTAAEMEAVANRIQLLVKGPGDWNPAYRYIDGFSPTQENNTYRYSDVLILLRRTSHQYALEQALRHAGIPYTLGGKGRGLFTRQETRDVSLFLNVLTNPADMYSLIGFLRSPWVGLSDEIIAEMAWSEEGFSTAALLNNYAAKTDIIDRYRELLGTRLSSEIVRMLIDETGFDALLAGLPRGTQRLANLRKVLDWLRENERGAQTTPAAVARKLAKQIQTPPQVPEAALLDPAQNAVTIMTVHGSKGLTKRVIVIPDISSRIQNDTTFCRVFHDTSSKPCLGITIDSPDKNAVKSPGFKEANDRAKSIREHEQNNLLYVAMTRARDLVITSASTGARPTGWLEKLTPLIDTEIPAILYSTLLEAAESSELLEPALPTVTGLSSALGNLIPPPARPRLQRIPATKLAKERDDHREQERVVSSIAMTKDLGSLGHAVLEQLALNSWSGSVKEWLETLRDDFRIGKTEAASLQTRIEQTRNLMQKQTGGIHKLRPEFPFVLHDGNTLIDGTIDLLCCSATTLSIFDYKFTEAGDSLLTDTYRRQMEIYHQAARHAFPALEKSETKLVVVSAQGPRFISVVI
jgi:ATP-dependent helicase/nuclease subunit A